MAVRQGHELLDLLEARLGESDAVDIAVAWAAAWRAIDELGEFCAGGGLLRVVVGIDGHATNPAALKQLAGFGQLRIGATRAPATRIFHPKYYCFHRGAGSTPRGRPARAPRARQQPTSTRREPTMAEPRMPTTLPSPVDREDFRFVAVDATGAIWEWIDHEMVWVRVVDRGEARWNG